MDLRPQQLKDIVLDPQIKTILNTIIVSAQKRKETLGHILIGAPPGLGKSTIAHAICNEMGSTIEFSNGANLRSLKDIAPYIMRLENDSIFFIDEIHRLTKIVQEFLYTVIEDGFCVLGKEQLKIKVPPFTMIGATTDIGRLSKPFRDRFKHHISLSLYKKEELTQIAQTNIKKLGIDINEEALLFIVSISRGTPRVLNRLLEWSRDYMLANSVKTLCKKHVYYAMQIIGINKWGLTKDDTKYLEYVDRAGIAGLNTIAAAIDIPSETIEQTIEPYLLSKNYVVKTSKGRMLGTSIKEIINNAL